MFVSGSGIDDGLESILIKEQLPLGLDGYIVNFSSIFEKENIKQAFTKHLKSEYNEDMMTFYDLVTKLPNDTSEKTLVIFWMLVDEYVTSGRVHGLNLSGKVRTIFFEKIKNQQRTEEWILNETPKEILQGPLDNVIFDFQGDVFSRFVMSKVCHEVMLDYVNDPNVITRTPARCIYLKIKKLNYKNLYQEDEMKLISTNLSKEHLVLENYLNFKLFLDSMNGEYHDFITNDKCVKLRMLLKQNLKKSKFFGTSQHYFDYSIMIGSLIFEWNESSVCIPKIMEPIDIFASFDLGEIPIEYIEEMFKILSSVIVTWNSTKQYSENNSGNSLNFVRKILHNMNTKFMIPSYISKHFQYLKDNSIQNPTCIELSSNLKKKFKQKKKLVDFQNHLELDNFFKGLIEIDQNFSQNYCDEFNLLKSFDDAFLIKYHSAKHQIKKLKELNNQSKEKIINLEKDIVRNDSFEIDICIIQKSK
eukprot:gene898-9809_t